MNPRLMSMSWLRQGPLGALLLLMAGGLSGCADERALVSFPTEEDPVPLGQYPAEEGSEGIILSSPLAADPFSTGFHLLPPLGTTPVDPGVFESSLLPNLTVQVCQVADGDCGSQVGAFSADGAGGEPMVWMDPVAEQYQLD